MFKEECGCGGWIKSVNNSRLYMCENCKTKYILVDGRLAYVSDNDFEKVRVEVEQQMRLRTIKWDILGI